MATPQSDDVYNDPNNILADTDDTVSGSVELSVDEEGNLSQSILTPEKTAPGDDRGPITELEPAAGNEDTTDPDSSRLSDMDPADERDGDEA